MQKEHSERTKNESISKHQGALFRLASTLDLVLVQEALMSACITNCTFPACSFTVEGQIFLTIWVFGFGSGIFCLSVWRMLISYMRGRVYP